jgi:2-polyprenyl-3-methyl-5-hydroxy-6-metoxy-1,4-benzoquinol methylase
LGETPRDPAYVEKMLHPIPAAEVVDREGMLLDLARGKRILEFGASGPTSAKVKAVAASYVGVDRQAADGVLAFDLDDVTQPALPSVETDGIVCSEILEHLSNPGHFLDRLARQYPGVPLIVTVPNAFTESGRQHALTGVENVNRDHVAWYSDHTLVTLLTRHGYTVTSFCWYRGKPYTAEGLIVLAETTNG